MCQYTTTNRKRRYLQWLLLLTLLAVAGGLVRRQDPPRVLAESRNARSAAGAQSADRPAAGPGSNTVADAAVPEPVAADGPIVSNAHRSGARRPDHDARAEATASMILPADFLDRVVTGKRLAFTLPDGKDVRGEVRMSGRDANGILFVQARLEQPAAGVCFLQRQTVAGVAGPMVGHVRFDGHDRAWKIEPTADLKAARFVDRTLDEVMCANYEKLPEAMETAPGNVQRAPQTHPTNIPIPPYQTVIPLQSLPGATGVLYLDFDGEEGPFAGWGSFTAAPSGATNAQVFEVWKMVCEDYQGFNLNVTTDRKVFDAATPGRRQQIIITSTDTAAPGAGGVAYLGTFNWGDSRPCWSFATTGKNAAEVISHELGHTLNLGHDGQTPSTEYYGGQGSGSTGWAPIMGVGYSQNLTQWSKGEYLNASNTQDDLAIIVNNNNDVGYRADDTGDTLATARYLEILSNGTVSGEGIIEQTGDVDAFRFRTNGGQATINVDPVSANPNLDIHAEIVDAVSLSVIVSNNPDAAINATLSANLPAGEYLLRVRGTGRGDPLIDGYSNYGCLGTYLFSGTVSNRIWAERFSIAEGTANGTAVGTVTARNNHGGARLTWSLASGNTGGAFAINPATGTITVANSAALDYEAFSSRWDDPADIELFVSITDAANPALDESIRTVVTLTNVNEAPVMTGGHFEVPEYAAVGSLVGTVNASEADRFDFLTFSILSGDPGGLFTIDPYSGAIRIATAMHMSEDKQFDLTIRAVDQGLPALSTTVTCTVHVINVSGQAATIIVSCDNGYELYANGGLVGSGSNWNQAGQHQGVALATGKNVIAIKGTDAGGIAGLLAEIVNAGQRLVTGTGWKVSTGPPSNWKDLSYDDSGWASATDYGAYGISPWYTNVSGMPGDTAAHWIWSSNNDADNAVYFRYSLAVEPESANDPPVIAQGDWVSVLMSKDSFPAPFSLTLSASDANGDAIMWSVDSPASHGTAVVSGTGTSKTIAYTPASGYAGVDSFVVRAFDANGGTDTITVNVIIRAIGNEPAGLLAEFFDYPSDLSALPDLSGKTPDVTRTDAQINYPSTTSAWTGLPSTMQETFASRHTGRLRIDTAGSYTFYLESDDGSKLLLNDALLISNDGLHAMNEVSATVSLTPGLHPIRVEFFENGGGAGLIFRWSGPGIAKQVVPASVLYQPYLPNVAPVANAQSVTTKADTAKAIVLTGSDANGDTLTYAIVTQPTHGTLSGTPPAVTYTPAAGYSGSDSFTCKVNDGTVDSAPATVTITVQRNAAPIANAQGVTVGASSSKAITLAGSDADGDTLTYAIVTQAAHGTLSGTPPAVTYTPAAGYAGNDSFTFKVNDGMVDSAPATVSISVLNNDAPAANAQNVTAKTATAKAITLSGSDANGDTLSYAIVTRSAHGTLSGTPPAVTYTSAAGYSGSDSFTFKVNDGLADSAPTTVLITVYQAAGPAAAFWAGEINANWTTAANWKTTVAGGIATGDAPANQTNVTFATTTPVAGNLTNALDADVHINSLSFATTAALPVTIGGTKMLKIEATGANGNTAGSGIVVGTPTSGSVTHTISANAGLAASQTWTVNSAGVSNNATLAASGAVTDSGGGYTFTKAGTGTLNLNGVTTVGSLNIGYQMSSGNVVVGNGGSLSVGRGSGNNLYVGVGSGGNGTLDASLSAGITASVGNFYVGSGSSGGTGTLKLGANNTITAATLCGVGTSLWDWTTGTLTTADASTTTIHTPEMRIGYGIANGTSSGTGTITLGSGASFTVDGVVAGNGSGRAVMWVGYDEEQYTRPSNGTVNLSAGTASLTLGSLVVGGQLGNATTPGTLTMGTSGSNHLDVSGAGSAVRIGYADLWNANNGGSATGTVTLANLDASSAITSTDNSTAILIGYRGAEFTGSCTGTLNLNGGTLTITTTGTAIGSGGSGGTSNLNLNGVTLKAGASSPTWLQGLTFAKIKSGGVVFDTNGNGITVAQALLADGTSPGGGLTKTGAGMLTLGGANTYTGSTIVSGGTLALGVPASLASSAGVRLAAGTQLDTSAQASYAIPAGQPITLHLSGAGTGTSGRITAAGLDIRNATVVLAIDTTLNDSVYVLAEYTSLTGSTLASVTAPPTGYSLQYNYNGNKIALVADVVSGYACWANGFSGPPLSNTSAHADPDGDGLPNAIEYVLGTDPRYSNRSGPKASSVGTDMVVTFSRSDVSETADMALAVQVSTDLEDWTTIPSYMIGATTETSSADVVVAENGTAADIITVTIPKGSNAKTFARLRAVVSE
ncbi:MAG: Ig-like domain-containing protein [Verrucomicrobia bacterium]|nr:Ig-like domain-containing protein [Verrucomicrobiota bacterium]